ncbi:hypothetical protein NBO_6g0117 [Nosema bombycis CQ1]|uniref:Uncharacterized protein n=1 Tax=Nosema bombycis (strain CQ1 / CVCC 102059) TaxID=578461 RepID=R0KYV5_NOSB1|nr:hypothetical protein NBO_6g0117 [Nosema bombycis CQ1]|eukprot:EOB15367.1 hypothetical protein NBO_6g0117 [Nosema bombycis CQ1]
MIINKIVINIFLIYYIICGIQALMSKYNLLSVLLIMSKLFATELLNLKNQIEKVDAFIKLIKYELDDCRKSETTIINEIKQVKESLNEKRKINSKSQNLEEIKKLENKMESLLKKQSNTCKKVVATEKRLKIKEDTRKKLVLGLERSERRASFIVQSPKANLKTKNIQCGKKSISYQCPVNTSLHHKNCFSPKELTPQNHSLKNLSHKASKDEDINQDNTPLKHPFNKNFRKTICDPNADITPIKQSNTRNSLISQKKNSDIIGKSETNLSSNKNTKKLIKTDPKTVKSLLPRPFNSNTFTPKRNNMHTTQIKPKTYIKPKPNVLPNTNSTAFRNTDDSMPKTDNSQIENESNDYEKFNGNINEFKDNNVIQEVHLSEEDILPLVCDLTEKPIMKDGDIESLRDSTLDTSDNLIEFTPQENVSKESNSLLAFEQTEKSMMKEGDIESVRDSTLDASDNLAEFTSQENVLKESNLLLSFEQTEKSILKDDNIESARDSTLDRSINLIEFTSQENVTETEYLKNEI